MLKHNLEEKTEEVEKDDPISDCIGEYGRWQFIHTFFLSLFSFSFTINVYSTTFTAAARDFWCARPDHLSTLSVLEWKNYSKSYDSCNILSVNWSSISLASIHNSNFDFKDDSYISCSSWEWDNTTFASTVISEWSLVCGRSYLATITEVMFLAGNGIGGIVCGTISDRYGRKNTLMTSLVCYTATGISMFYCNSLALYMALKFITGFAIVSAIFAAFLLAVELIGGKWITIVGICNFYPLPLSYIIVTGMSKVLRDWRYLQLSLTIPGFMLIGLWWVLPESPRWLLSNGDFKALEKVLQRASSFNNRPLPSNMDKILAKQVANNNAEFANEKHQFLDLFTKKCIKITLASIFGWFVNTLIYYAMIYRIGSLGGDLHLTSFLSAAVEIPAVALSIPLLMKFGRRLPISISMSMTGVLYLISIFFDSDSYLWIKISFAIVGKFTASIVNAVFPLLTAELFPTLLRNVGLGIGQFSAGLALVTIPYLWLLEEYSRQIPLGVVGVFGIIGGFIILLLPETNNKPLGAVTNTANRATAASTAFATGRTSKRDCNDDRP